MRFIHTADCHVGCRQYGMQEREEDFYRSLHNIAQKAIDNSVDFVLVSGDLFDTPKPSARAVYEVRKWVQTLEEKRIKVKGIEGNHDLTKDNYWLQVCGIEPLDTDSDNVVAGINFCRGDELLERLEVLANECEETAKKYPVVALHCGAAEMGCAFNPDVSLEQLVPSLKRIRCKYCALGHIHIPMEQFVDGIAFVQPGSIEVKSSDEQNEKFVELVEINDKVNLCRIPLQTRKFILETVEKVEDLDELRKIDTSESPFVMAYVLNSVSEGIVKASDILKEKGVMHRVVPVGDKEQQKTYDRTKSMDLLKDAVLTFFDEGSDQYKMIMDILSTNNPRLVVENYLNKEAT